MKLTRIFLSLALLLACATAQAQLRLPSAVGDNMVLQRNTDAAIWGWCAPNANVSVIPSWDGGRIHIAPADASGAWLIKVPTPMGSYTPHTIEISDGKNRIIVKNVLVGEVWVCGGQSNMNMPLRGNTAQPVEGSLEAILTAGKYKDKIRIIALPRRDSNTPEDDFEGRWEVPSPIAAYKFNALPYFFAQYINEVLDVPVGIISNSWGGSRIESWIDEETISKVKGFDVESAKSPKLEPRQRVAQLYNGLVYPVRNYTARGFLWYQGESSRHSYRHYANLQASMVELWRQSWGDKTAAMPFYYVQIAPYAHGDSKAITAPLLVEAQIKALGMIPNSGIVGTTDLGKEGCIHPPQKKEIALRLATMALIKTYAVCNLPSTGPMYQSSSFEGKKVIVKFSNAPMGLSPSYEAPIVGFELAGPNKVFHPAKAVISKDDKTTLIITSHKVSKPVAVRYAFRNWYEGANLSDTFGLPAFPFRSDHWDDVK